MPGKAAAGEMLPVLSVLPSWGYFRMPMHLAYCEGITAIRFSLLSACVIVRVTTDSICTKYPGRQVDISFLYFQLQAVRSLLGCLALLLGHDPSVPVCSYCIIHLWIWVELGWPGTTD